MSLESAPDDRHLAGGLARRCGDGASVGALLMRLTGTTRTALPCGSDPNTDWPGVVFPIAEQLLVLDGAAHLEFFGLDWAYTNLPMPTQGWPEHAPEPGYATIQSGWQWMDADKKWNVADALPGSVELRGANHILFEECRFAHYGGSGITIGEKFVDASPDEYYESSDNVIDKCEVFDLGGHGIDLGDQRTQQQNAWLSGHSPTRPDPHDNNLITDSYIHHYGVIYKDGVGILVAHTRDTTINHCFVELGNWSGMAIGGLQRHKFSGVSPPDCGIPVNAQINWPQTNEHIRVIGNRVHKACLRQNDGGGIYVMGSQQAENGPVSELDGNYISEINYSPFKNFIHVVVGVYFDGGSDGWRVTNNYVAHAQYPFRFAAKVPGTATAPSEAVWAASTWPVPWMPTCIDQTTYPFPGWPGQEWDELEPNWWWIPIGHTGGYDHVNACPGNLAMDFNFYPASGTHENYMIYDLGAGGAGAIRDAAGPDPEYFDTWFPGEGEEIYALPYRPCPPEGPYVEIEWPW